FIKDDVNKNVKLLLKSLLDSGNQIKSENPASISESANDDIKKFANDILVP
ncbi:4888_t:CDS:1, partial [Cetraspora pellucida]